MTFEYWSTLHEYKSTKSRAALESLTSVTVSDCICGGEGGRRGKKVNGTVVHVNCYVERSSLFWGNYCSIVDTGYWICKNIYFPYLKIRTTNSYKIYIYVYDNQALFLNKMNTQVLPILLHS
jgi:hypothetical protein